MRLSQLAEPRSRRHRGRPYRDGQPLPLCPANCNFSGMSVHYLTLEPAVDARTTGTAQYEARANDRNLSSSHSDRGNAPADRVDASEPMRANQVQVSTYYFIAAAFRAPQPRHDFAIGGWREACGTG